MPFRELWSLCAPVWTSCLKYWGDLLWITLCTKIHWLYWRCSFKGNGPYKMCPRPVSIGEAAQRTLTARLCTDWSCFYFYMSTTAAIPNIRDIINSGHNVRVKKRITSFTVTNVFEARQQVHIFSKSVWNTANMSLPFKLVIKNNTKVTVFWNLLYYLWI